MDEYTGIIRIFGGNFAPRGWMMCQGQLLSISAYTALYSLIGTTYGGDGQTTFALPDLRSRTVVGGFGTAGPGTSPIELGEVGGTESVTLITNQMPSHNHSVMVNDTDATQSAATSGAIMALQGTTATGTFVGTNGYNATAPDTALNGQTVNMQGGSIPHENMQPFMAMNYIICVEGIFPSRN